MPVLVGNLPFVHGGNTMDYGDRHMFAPDDCFNYELDFGGGAPDVTYRFVAPASRHYLFSATPDGWDAGLFVLGDCTDASTCGKVGDVFLEGGTEIVAPFVPEGAAVTVVIDGFVAGEEGPFTMEVAPAGACVKPLPIWTWPFSDVANTDPYGDQFSHPANCGTGLPAFGSGHPDTLYVINTAEAGEYLITLTPNADFDGALFLFGECDRPAMSCIAAGNAGGQGFEESIRVALEADTDYYLVVDGGTGGMAAREAGGYRLDFEFL